MSLSTAARLLRKNRSKVAARALGALGGAAARGDTKITPGSWTPGDPRAAEAGRVGGSVTGDCKRRSPEQYRRASDAMRAGKGPLELRAWLRGRWPLDLTRTPLRPIQVAALDTLYGRGLGLVAASVEMGVSRQLLLYTEISAIKALMAAEK